MKSPKTKQKPTRRKRIKSIKIRKSKLSLSPRKKKVRSPVKTRQFLVSRNRSKVLVLDILKSKPVALVLPKEAKSQYIVSNYSRGLRNFFFKTAPVVLMIALLSINFAGAKRTFAVFNDSDSFLANSLVAGTLDFSANSGGELLFNLRPGESQKKDIIIANNGTLNFQYNVVVENISDNGDFCDKIQSSVDLDNSPVYSGSLINFTSGDIVFTPTEDRWTFNVSLPSESDNLENKTCQFKFVFNGRQDNLPSGFGFNDTQNIQSNFQIDPNSCDSSDDGEDYQSFHKNKEDEGGKDENDKNDDENNKKHCGRHDNNGEGEHEENKENDINNPSTVAGINEDESKENKPKDEEAPVSLDENKNDETENKDTGTATPETNNSNGSSDNQTADSPQPTPTNNNPAT